MHLVIFMPALNEAENIQRVVRSLPRELPGFDVIEYLVVDDGSTDATSAEARAGGAIVVRHEVNKGVGGAFQTAVNTVLARGADVLVTIDADGQFDSGEIPSLVAQITEHGADFVTGNRFHTGKCPENMPAVKYWGNHAMTWLIRSLSGIRLNDVSCGFRAYNRRALLHLNLFGKFTYTQETILDLAHKELVLRDAPISVKYFAERKSRVAGSIFRYAFNTSLIIFRTVRDYHPFKFFGGLGVAVFLLGFAMDLVPLVNWIATGSFSPYKFFGFAGAILNTAGLLIFGLGMVTDLLDRIRMNQERLLYYEKRLFYDTAAKNGDVLAVQRTAETATPAVEAARSAG